MAQTVLVTLTVLFLSSLAAFGQNVQPKVQHNLIDILLKSGRAMGSERNLECFSKYLPKINEATAKYEAAYTVCLQNAANSKQRVENEVAKDRENVTVSAKSIIDNYSGCINLDSSLDFFQCTTKVSGDSISVSYDIQNISKAKAQYILLRHETITYDQNVCTDGASSAYIAESSRLYAELDACLAGTQLKPEQPSTAAPETTPVELPTTLQ